MHAGRFAIVLLAAGLAATDLFATEDPPPDRGKLDVSLRWRYEDVAVDGFDKDAHASTLRTTLAYSSPFRKGLGGFVEFEDVHDVGLDDQHANGGAGSLDNGVIGRPVIADPESTEVNQVYLRYQGLKGVTLDAGRMEILIADERFVGPVGFRQNHQSFDGARVSLTSIPRTRVFYGFVGNVNRINGGNHGMDSHLLDVEIDLGRYGKIAPYGYHLDYDAAANAGLSTRTLGARWDGTLPVGSTWSVPLHAQLAMQRDVGDNPIPLDAEYWRLEASLARPGLAFGVGLEQLGGDSGTTDKGSFQTPLATLHKFNGAADLFLTTPLAGLRDAYATVSGKRKTVSWIVTFHDYEADVGSIPYGTELDAEVTWQAPWKQAFGLIYAAYDADQFASDTKKLWVFTTYRFGARL